MLKDMYDTFDNECIAYSYPFSFQENKKDYMVGNVPTYEMDYGDTAVFPFFITENFLDSDILITIYNNRYESIYETIQQPDNNQYVYLEITSELSAKLYKGNFYIRLQAREHQLYNETENTTDYNSVCTILSTAECSLYIK